MRPIKFRGKRLDNQKWIYGDLIHGQGSKRGKMYILPQTAIYPNGCSELDGWQVIPETVEQFTNLSDWAYGNVVSFSIKYLKGHYWLVNKNGIACYRLSGMRTEIIITRQSRT